MIETIQLPTILNRKGAQYKLLKRGAKTLLYARKVYGCVRSYEVFRIKIRNSVCIAGKEVPCSEIFPHDEAFGDWAHSFVVIMPGSTSYSRALNKFIELENIKKPTNGLHKNT